jgi:hypothetical protein
MVGFPDGEDNRALPLTGAPAPEVLLFPPYGGEAGIEAITAAIPCRRGRGLRAHRICSE